MATVYNTTFQLRRGNASVWEKNNPILARGEPGFVIDENRLKIGDGSTPWMELDYIGESSIQNFDTHEDFPSSGRENVIYKAEKEKALYQWSAESQTYEPLSFGETQLEVDENVFDLTNDKLELQGFSDAEAGMMPVKSEDGKISWVNTNNKQVEDLNNAVEEVEEKLQNIEEELENVYTKEETQELIEQSVVNSTHLKRIIVKTLPTEDIDSNAIYMVKKTASLLSNTYNEYIYVEGEWELLGDTAVDLTQYAKISYVDSALETKANQEDLDLLKEESKNYIVKPNDGEFLILYGGSATDNI